MLKTKEEIKNWLDRCDVENYIINEDLTVDVNGNVILTDKNLKVIPIKFNIVKGHFDCSGNKLTSLEFAPKEIGKNFDFSFNKLTSLEGCTEIVGYDFIYNNNSFKNKIYNNDDFNKEDLLKYLKNKSLKKELDKEIVNKVVVKRIKI